MFKSKCFNCNNKVSKKYEFCPYCGSSLKSSKEDYGFLGKEDSDDNELKLPFGFKMLMKPLMKELNKQMIELDKEIKSSPKNVNKQNKNFTSFSIHIGIPGNRPIKIKSFTNGENLIGEDISDNDLKLPKIDSATLMKIKNLPRKEPETNVRRLSDKVIYEISLPGVDSIKKINIVLLEEGFEIKALSNKEIFVKFLKVDLPLINYSLKEHKLFLEFALR